MTTLISHRRAMPSGRTLSDPTLLASPRNRVQRASADSWHWLYATEAGVAVQGPPVRFASEDTAQEWLDHHAGELLELRIARVSLLDGERVVDTAAVQEFSGHLSDR